MKCNEMLACNQKQPCPPQLAEIYIERQPYVALYTLRCTEIRHRFS